ncbi:MAG TPA: hypothetical protein VEG39_20990 [Clostridia bacterium]|nr:hypothetical protein [Clostridia bacterium]
MIVIWLAALVFVPLKHWKNSWPIGIFGMVCIYAIDGTLVYLGAFRFWGEGIYISGIPLCYCIGYFPGGILFDHFRSHEYIKRPLYILITAAVLLAMELIMAYFGYFQHLSWNAYRAYLLNAGGFTILMWLSEWMEQGRN